MQPRVMIIEDETLIRWSLRQKFTERGYLVKEAETGAIALQALDRGVFDLIMLDYKLPDTTGLEILRHLRRIDDDTVVVMMTAYSTIESAVEAIKLGAFDYITKPFEMDELLFTVDKALETTKLRREIRELRRRLHEQFGTDSMIGQHPSMLELFETVQKVARTGASTVFLRGETGTGKDLIARVIHRNSDRASAPFINITCTALSETLLESELFGHERGSFTDAKAQKQGLLELAHTGTVFLDEVGDMPSGLQAKLLRFLEERRLRRVGGTEEITVDVRVIAATNRDLDKAIANGQFRRDLMYRLDVVTIHVPPLRERGEDITLLAQHLAARFAAEFKKPVSGIDEAAREKLQEYYWPGNVRELRNAVERAVLLCRGPQITVDDLVIRPPEPNAADIENFKLPPEGFDLEKLKRLEANLLRQAMARSDNILSRAGRLLHITRDRVRTRLRKHGLSTGDGQ